MSEAKLAYSKVTLDVIGIFALGMELKNLDRPSEFLACYQAVFDLDTTGQILAAINTIVPIRWLAWLPLPAANRKFVQANATLRRMLSQITQDRINEVIAGKTNAQIPGAPNKDLLTFMVEEKYMSEKDPWMKADLVEQVLNFVATGMKSWSRG
jgi:cytochrome P450